MKHLSSVSFSAFVAVYVLVSATAADARCHSVWCDVKRSAEVNTQNGTAVIVGGLTGTAVPPGMPKPSFDIHKPFAGIGGTLKSIGQGVGHLAEESWKVAKRPFVETGKFLNDPWGLKKKIPQAVQDVAKRLGAAGEALLLYAVLGLVGLILICAVVSTIFARIFSRKERILVVRGWSQPARRRVSHSHA